MSKGLLVFTIFVFALLLIDAQHDPTTFESHAEATVFYTTQAVLAARNIVTAGNAGTVASVTYWLDDAELQITTAQAVTENLACLGPDPSPLHATECTDPLGSAKGRLAIALSDYTTATLTAAVLANDPLLKEIGLAASSAELAQDDLNLLAAPLAQKDASAQALMFQLYAADYWLNQAAQQLVKDAQANPAYAVLDVNELHQMTNWPRFLVNRAFGIVAGVTTDPVSGKPIVCGAYSAATQPYQCVMKLVVDPDISENGHGVPYYFRTAVANHLAGDYGGENPASLYLNRAILVDLMRAWSSTDQAGWDAGEQLF